MNNDIKQMIAVLDRLVAAHQRSVWDNISVIAIVLTLLVLIWYTVETYRLRVAAVKQLDVATTPIVMIAPDEQSDVMVPTIRNVGRGPAFNISVRTDDLGADARLDFYFPDPLAANEVQKLHLILQQSDRQRQMFTHEQVVTNFAQHHLPPTVKLTITYNGANGKVYSTTMAMEYRAEVLFYQFGKHTMA